MKTLDFFSEFDIEDDADQWGYELVHDQCGQRVENSQFKAGEGDTLSRLITAADEHTCPAA